MDSIFSVIRSPHFPHCRDVFLHCRPYCEICGRKAPDVTVEVHHEIPVEYLLDPVINRPDLELDPRNFVGLCRHADCMAHPYVGHLGDFKSWNPWLAKTIKLCRWRRIDAIKALPQWIAMEGQKPKYVEHMSLDEKRAMRLVVDQKFPLAPAKTAA